ncbi:unnamed protein product [Trichogramma brassicae]|uniref:Uncharacterized protein n=1 Tax=Trichogramma brassicae TaxID=86971 RepID=A0A6H5IP26_9HYME|nr:unnamed protein product [Trichogramma brassicae]
MFFLIMLHDCKLIKRFFAYTMNDPSAKERLFENMKRECDSVDNVDDLSVSLFDEDLVDINSMDLNWILKHAVKKRCFQIVRYFVRADIKVGRLDESTGTAIHIAHKGYYRTEEDRQEVVGLLFIIYDHVNYTDKEGLSHFHMACLCGIVDVIQRFIDQGVDVNHTHKNEILLHKSCHCAKINVREVKYLGITLDDRLKYNSHLEAQINKAKMMFAKLQNLFHSPYLSQRAKIISYLCLIRPILVYGCPVWFNLSASSMEKLRMFERKIVRICLNKYKSAHSGFTRNIITKRTFENLHEDFEIVRNISPFNFELQCYCAEKPILEHFFSVRVSRIAYTPHRSATPLDTHSADSTAPDLRVRNTICARNHGVGGAKLKRLRRWLPSRAPARTDQLIAELSQLNVPVEDDETVESLRKKLRAEVKKEKETKNSDEESDKEKEPKDPDEKKETNIIQSTHTTGSNEDIDMSDNLRIEYRLNKDDWETFTEQLEQLFIARDVKDDKKASQLLIRVDADAFKLIKQLLSPEKIATKTYEDIVKVMNEHVNPKPSEVMERFKFHKATQLPGETVAEFSAKLKRLALKCEFKDLDTALRDQFVCGLSDHDTKVELFKKVNSHLTMLIKKQFHVNLQRKTQTPL